MLFCTLIEYDTQSLPFESSIFILNPDISILSFLFGVKKTTVLVTAVLAAVLTVGLTVLPTSIQEAQANPCANEISRGGSADNAFIPQDDDERECDFTGYFDFDEEIDSEDIPPTPTGAFTVSGEGSGTYTCTVGAPTGGSIVISAQGEGDGTATGTISIVIFGSGGVVPFTGTGNTDGNTFSLSGVRGNVGCGLIGQSEFTVSGDCGNDVMISYQDDSLSGTFTGDVECTLL